MHHQSLGQPYLEFAQRTQLDLAKWTRKEHQALSLLQDYQRTLALLEQEAPCPKVMVDLGEECLAKGKRIDKEKIVLRMKEGLWVELSREEALPIVRRLVELNQRAVGACGEQVARITASVASMQRLLEQAEAIA